jgi:proline iminopeptidase
MATCRLIPDTETILKAEDIDFAVAFARIECHYFMNQIFVEDCHILNNINLLKHIPTTIV